MLAHCFPQVSGFTPTSSQNTIRMTKHQKKGADILLPPLGKALASVVSIEECNGIVGRNRPPNRLRRRQQARSQAQQRQIAYSKACVALEILRALSAEYTAVGDAVLQSVFNRIYQQLTESIKVFPSPGILLRFVHVDYM